MRKALLPLVFLAAALAPSAALADSETALSDAVQLCRTTVAQQAGVAVDAVRMTDVRDSLRRFRVTLSVSRNGASQTVRCDVSRGAQPAVTAIDPPVAAAAAQ